MRWPMQRQGMVVLIWMSSLTIVVGCHGSRPDPAAEKSDGAAVDQISSDPRLTGMIRGRVQWNGEPPTVPAFEVRNLVTPTNPPKSREWRQNPNTPSIDPSNKGVGGAVVFL